MPEFVLFGDSLTEWGFSETTQGFGRFLQQKYQYKVGIVNEGRLRCGFYQPSSIKVLRHGFRWRIPGVQPA